MLSSSRLYLSTPSLCRSMCRYVSAGDNLLMTSSVPQINASLQIKILSRHDKILIALDTEEISPVFIYW